MWCDTSKDDIEVKVKRAIDKYVKLIHRYKKPPTHCYVHPSACEEDFTIDVANGRVKVVRDTHTLLNHFFVGHLE